MDAEPANNDQRISEEDQKDVRYFRFFTQPITGRQIIVFGCFLLFGGVYLLRYPGRYQVIGGVLIFAGFWTALVAPELWGTR